MAVYNSFSSIPEKQKDLEHLIKFSHKKCEISHLPIPFFCRSFTCSILAFLAHVLLSCHRCVISQQYKLSLFQPYWLKYCGYLSPVRCFFFSKLLCYLSLMFQFFHVILTFCVFEDAKSAFSHLLHIILLEMISLAPLPNSLFFSSWQIYNFRLWTPVFFKVQSLQSKLETRGVHLLPMVLPPFSHPNLVGPLLHMSFPELPCPPPASWYHLPLSNFLITPSSPPHCYYFFSCFQHENLLHFFRHLAHELPAPCVSLACSHCKD